jgi:hypothetical protein
MDSANVAAGMGNNPLLESHYQVNCEACGHGFSRPAVITSPLEMTSVCPDCFLTGVAWAAKQARKLTTTS